MNDQPPAWTQRAADLVGRLTRSGVRIRALKLTDEQYEDMQTYTRSHGVAFTTLFGYPVRRR